jgi:hypothetical protein
MSDWRPPFGEYEARLLDQAVTAYRAALKELPREQVPLQWAVGQSGLGDALLETVKTSSAARYAASASRSAAPFFRLPSFPPAGQVPKE